MGRREALLEQQPHRVALVAEGGLHADEDVAELRAEHEDRAPSLCCRPGAGPHCASISRSQRSRRTWSSAGMRAWTLACAPKRCARCRRGSRSRSSSTSAGQVDGVAVGAQRPQRAGTASRRRQEGGRAGAAGVRREVEQHHGDPALGLAVRRSAGADERAATRVGAACRGAAPACNAQSRGSRSGRRAVGAAAEHDRARRAVELGDRHHDGGLDRRSARGRKLPTARASGTPAAGRRGRARRARPASPRPRCASL